MKINPFVIPLTGPKSKKYGPHEYNGDPDQTINCQHGCGSWMGPSRSGAPIGIDPDGTCPVNPEDGERLGGNQDVEYIIEQRIALLQEKAREAETRLVETERIHQELRSFINHAF